MFNSRKNAVTAKKNHCFAKLVKKAETEELLRKRLDHARTALWQAEQNLKTHLKVQNI